MQQLLALVSKELYFPNMKCRSGRSAVPGVSPGRGFLIPHGYLQPDKSEHSEV